MTQSAGGNVDSSPPILQPDSFLPSPGSIPARCWTNPIFTGLGIPHGHDWGRNPGLPKLPSLNSPSFPRLGCHYFNPASGTSTRDQLHLPPCACWGFACSCHLPNFSAMKYWISCSALLLAPMWLCQLLASVAEIRANFQSRSDLGFLSKPICSWLRVIPTTFIAGWDNELLHPQISTTWSSFNSFPLQKVKAASASCAYQPGQQARQLITDNVNCFKVLLQCWHLKSNLIFLPWQSLQIFWKQSVWNHGWQLQHLSFLRRPGRIWYSLCWAGLWGEQCSKYSSSIHLNPLGSGGVQGLSLTPPALPQECCN